MKSYTIELNLLEVCLRDGEELIMVQPCDKFVRAGEAEEMEGLLSDAEVGREMAEVNFAEVADERDTLRARVAELEEDAGDCTQTLRLSRHEPSGVNAKWIRALQDELERTRKLALKLGDDYRACCNCDGVHELDEMHQAFGEEGERVGYICEPCSTENELAAESLTPIGEHAKGALARNT